MDCPVVTEDELFDRDSHFDFENFSSDRLKVVYTVDPDEKCTSNTSNHFIAQIKKKEVEGIEPDYVWEIKDSDSKVETFAFTLRRAMADMIRFYRETMQYTNYTYESIYGSNDNLIGVKLLKNDYTIFTIGEFTEDEIDHTIRNELPFEFYNALYHIERNVTSHILSNINHTSIGVESIRFPISDMFNTPEKELLVHINKYLLQYYKNNYLITDDPMLYQLFHYTGVIIKEPPTTSKVTIQKITVSNGEYYSERWDEQWPELYQ